MEFKVNSIDDLDQPAEAILAMADNRHNVVALYGEMGAGKTTLVAALCRLAGVDDTVTSPTFALINQYLRRSGESIYHFDFYRIERLEEAFDMGYEEYFDSGAICLVEWPEKIAELLPDTMIRVDVEVTGETRRTIRVEKI